MNDGFKCSCPTTAQLVERELHGITRLCPTHDRAELERREAEVRRRAVEVVDDRRRAVMAAQRAEWAAEDAPACTCMSTADALRVVLEGGVPAPCPAHPSGDEPRSTPAIPLNDDTSLTSILRGALGAGPDVAGTPPAD